MIFVSSTRTADVKISLRPVLLYKKSCSVMYRHQMKKEQHRLDAAPLQEGISMKNESEKTEAHIVLGRFRYLGQPIV